MCFSGSRLYTLHPISTFLLINSRQKLYRGIKSLYCRFVLPYCSGETGMWIQDINLAAQERDTINSLSKWLTYVIIWVMYHLNLYLQENNECWTNRGNYKILGKINVKMLGRLEKNTDSLVRIEMGIIWTLINEEN